MEMKRMERRGFRHDAEIRCEDVSSSLTCFYTPEPREGNERLAHIAHGDGIAEDSREKVRSMFVRLTYRSVHSNELSSARKRLIENVRTLIFHGSSHLSFLTLSLSQ